MVNLKPHHVSTMNYDQSLEPHELNPTRTRRISLLSTPWPRIDNTDNLLVVGFNYKVYQTE